VEFVDTDVLIYVVSRRSEDQEKARVARALIDFSKQAISLQVLREFYNAATHASKLAFRHNEALTLCAGWRNFKILEPTLRLFDDATAICDRFQISYYDAAIIAAARTLGCDVIYSEDLHHGQRYGPLRVENPFRGL